MLTKIISWFLTNPLGQKVGIIIIAAVACFVIAQQWGNSQYQKGKESEVKIITEEVRAQLEKDLKAREDAVAADKKAIAADKAAIAKDKALLVPMRAQLTQAITELRTTTATQLEQINAIVLSTPPERLASDIKRKSAELGYPADRTAPAANTNPR